MSRLVRTVPGATLTASQIKRLRDAEAYASRIVLTVPMPKNIANGSHGHWRARHREKLAYWDKLDLLCAAKLLPAPPGRPWPRARITSTMHLGMPMDTSNAMRRHKWIEDWLVTREYIEDDREAGLHWTGFPEQVVKRLKDKDYRIVLTLEAVA